MAFLRMSGRTLSLRKEEGDSYKWAAQIYTVSRWQKRDPEQIFGAIWWSANSDSYDYKSNLNLAS